MVGREVASETTSASMRSFAERTARWPHRPPASLLRFTQAAAKKLVMRL